MTSATFLGLMFHQLTCKPRSLCSSLTPVLAHDAGHTGVTGVWFWDRLIGMTVANWVGGLSLGWWCDVSPAQRTCPARELIRLESQRSSSYVIGSSRQVSGYPLTGAVVTNHPEHDPDIQHIPFFAISKTFFGSLWSTYYKRVMGMDAFSKAMISVQ